MGKLHLEVALGVAFVAGASFIAYNLLAQNAAFWNSQGFWNGALLACWAVVALSYYRQGAIIRKAKSASHVSILLPFVVFFVQCILFVKGVHYRDYALVIGAVLVNCGVVFEMYQIFSLKKERLAASRHEK